MSWGTRTSHLAERLLLQVAAALSLIACSPEGQDVGGEGLRRAVEVQLGGRIIGGGAQSILSFDLSDGSHVEVARWPSLIVNDLSRIDANRLLVSVDIRSPSQHGDRSWDWVAIYDMRSNELRYLVKGSRAVYVPERELMVYYRVKQLRVADLSGRLVRTVDVDGSAYPPPGSIVLVSATEFVYGSWPGGAYGVWRHDLDTGETVGLPGLRDCALDNAVWRRATGELLCSKQLPSGRVTGKRFLTDLDGGNRREFEFGARRLWSGRSRPVVYMDDADAVLFLESTANLWRGEYYPLHVHRFSDGLEV